jgi:hypothetical protein
MARCGVGIEVPEEFNDVQCILAPAFCRLEGELRVRYETRTLIVVEVIVFG